MLATVGYDPDAETLIAQFNTGDFYKYDGVPSDSFVGVITNGESHGRAFNELIKRHFEGVKITAEEARLFGSS